MANLVEIEKLLKERGFKYRVIDLGGEIFSVEDVVAAGVERKEVVKTLLVRTNDGFVALCLRGDDRVDFKKVRAMFGNRSEMAKPDEVLKIVGVPIGAVCPILVGAPVCLDEQVMKIEKVNMGSGNLEKGLEMKLADLLTVIGNYEVKDLSKNE
ncbi:YbaK/EbsC family protein [Candidatus Curtissbacteria bacterium]|nr:YbaK/EbsC family protein [Candidatus Curtissbacteria bacterium]